MRTRIDGGWVVGFDPVTGGHYLLRDGVVVVEDKKIAYVGQAYTEPVDRVIAARGKLVSPGFVNTHVHSGIDVMSGLQDLPPQGVGTWIGASEECLSHDLVPFLTEEQIRTHMEYGIVHLLKTGCTTILDVIGSSSPWWLGNTPRDVEVFVESAGQLGARVYAPLVIARSSPASVPMARAHISRWKMAGLGIFSGRCASSSNTTGATTTACEGCCTPMQ